MHAQTVEHSLITDHQSLVTWRLEMPSQEPPYFLPGFEGQCGINPVEMVASGRVGIYVIAEFLPSPFQRTGQFLDFADIYILIIRVGLDEQRCAQFFCIPRGRTAPVFLRRFGDGLAAVIWRREDL